MRKEGGIKYHDDSQPRQLYLGTLVEFYGKMGSRKFWADMKSCEIALEALSQDYIRADHSEHLEEDATSLQAAINEYLIREHYMVRQDLGGKG